MVITGKESFYRRKSIIAPFFLILIWSTGFIAARAVADHADPNLFLTFRFLIAAAVFALLAAHCVWPKGRQLIMHLLTGMLMNGVYLAASWWAVANGLAAGVMSLIGGLQPLFTALMLLVPPAAALQAYFLFGEALSLVQLTGFMLTLLGVAIVQRIRLLRRSNLV
ncbi:carboxylate/amino acid/amine transporter [Serratia quinivorans]|uniref:EamA family transporter n=1 Tax=Serratia quinivorans TaxID=137545 RepID=UPI002178A8EA|nr:EamA family transporter [Serratia quinivorans]CAI1852505.1 carboxylate/amino acid/amine transporter [Serratia quinivorans]